MKIAVIGAGFAGLAAAWHLLESSHLVTLFDEKPLGGGTSGMAAGLMHPFSRNLQSFRPLAIESLKATIFLFQEVEKVTGKKVFEKGLVHVSDTGEKSFIEDGYTVDAKAYLEGLFLSGKKKGLKWEQKAITSLEELSSFDHVVVAAGFFSQALLDVPLNPLKGQVAEIELDFDLECSQIGPCYVAKMGTKCYLGATFERGKSLLETDFSFFESDLAPKWESLSPIPWKSLKFLQLRAGIRATTRNRMPIAKVISEKLSLLTGFGSRGLLYHAYFAKLLARSLEDKSSFLSDRNLSV